MNTYQVEHYWPGVTGPTLYRAQAWHLTFPHSLNQLEPMKQNTYTIAALVNAGFPAHEIEQLTRISTTLRRWFELECGSGDNYASWAIERDEVTEKPYLVTHPHTGKSYRRAIPDREAGARKRLAKLMESHPDCQAYVQGDPRGCALYILRACDIPAGESPASCYNRGIAVCH